MSPIPGKPHDSTPLETTTPDGRKVRLKAPGLEPKPKPNATEERGAEEPPREDPRSPLNPYTTGF